MCGVFGVAGSSSAFSRTKFGIYDLQHRGEQGAGISASDGNSITTYKDFGLVSEVFSPQKKQIYLNGKLAIGHTLYSTIGRQGEEKQEKSIQSHMGTFKGNEFAISFNGNLTELNCLREEARAKGFHFQSESSDTEVMVALLSVSEKRDFMEALTEVLPRPTGAFALVILYRDKVIGVRDSCGIRPLCLGRDDKSFMLASESCAFYTEGGNFVRDINPGEMIVLNSNGVEGDSQWASDASLNICIVEHLYFARPESVIDGCSVNNYRYTAGMILAKEHPLDPLNVDLVSSVPDSGRNYDDGFCGVSRIPHRQAVYRNRYVTTRSFLTSREIDKRFLQRRKLHVLRHVVYGKRICLTEDSVFRGYVSSETVSMCREQGAIEVHVRIGSAPVRHICESGIDIPTRAELVASDLSVEEIQEKIIQCDSLEYLSVEGMIKATGLSKGKICLGCFTGEYPVKCKNKNCV
jgi:amidophosphoribosyltransferase